MKVEYRKDMHHNYMVISTEPEYQTEAYCIKMLSNQSIEGVLSLELRMMDNKQMYYYDITGKQAMNNIMDKKTLNYEKIKVMLLHILVTIENAYDYLLNVDDFILSSEYIYMDVATDHPYLCYISGYHVDIKYQMNSFMEYIMNQVNYNDKEAVLLVYSLYAASKEEGFTFDRIKEILHNNLKTPKLEEKHGSRKEVLPLDKTFPKKQVDIEEVTEKSLLKKGVNRIRNNWEANISVMKEKIEDEEEIPCYSLKTYLYTAGCILGGVIIIIFGFLSKLLYNSFGDRVDMSKFFALCVVLLCLEGYLMKMIWNKKNQITKMVRKSEYIDPRSLSHIEERPCIGNAITDTEHMIQEEKIPVATFDSQEDYNPTCILNEEKVEDFIFLKPLDEIKYQPISITEFPFFIGKLKKNVDYSIEKDVVSRYHAKITKEKDHYYITDLNSTNGTFVNHEPIQTYESREILIGDEIAFANIRYLFLSSKETK